MGALDSRPRDGWGRFVSGRVDVGREREGWVPACARTTEGEGMGHVPVSTGAGSPREQREGMGPRIREDNGGDGRFANRAYGLLTTRASAAWGQSIFIAITGRAPTRDAPTGAGEDS